MKQKSLKFQLRVFAAAIVVSAAVFVALKLCGLITWPWWWLPVITFTPPALFLMVVGLAVIGAFLLARDSYKMKSSNK